MVGRRYLLRTVGVLLVVAACGSGGDPQPTAVLSAAELARWEAEAAAFADRYYGAWPHVEQTFAEFADATLQFGDRSIGILKRHRAQSDKPRRVALDVFRKVVVEDPGQLQCVLTLRPVGEHHRHGGQHLDVDTGAVAVVEPRLQRPAILRDLAEPAFADHHPRLARAMVFQPDPAGIAESAVQIGPLLGQDVRVQVDRQRTQGHTRFTSARGAAPSLLCSVCRCAGPPRHKSLQ